MRRFDHHDAVRAVAEEMRTRLLQRGSVRHVELLDTLDLDAVGESTAFPDLAVLQHIGAAVAEVEQSPAADLAAALRTLGRTASWTQTESYRSDPPSAGFLDRYAHATLAGPPDGNGHRPRTAPDVSIGLLLLGPNTHYPPHEHPADEVYLPVTEARWTHDRDGSYRPVAAGTLLHHAPGQAHGMRTSDAPLLAIYLWTGNVRTPSRFC